jgi:DNA-binding transcriptional ArsR family regulator
MVFVNRTKELENLGLLADAFLKGDKSNAAIIGIRRIGKTEVLMKFKNDYKEKNLIIPYFNVQKIGDVSSFVFIYIREMLVELGLVKGIVKYRTEIVNWNDLIILATKLGIESEIKKLQENQVIWFLFEVQEIILEKLGYHCIYLLDEFQYVTILEKRFLETMRSVVEKQKLIAYITSGSSIRMMEDIFVNKDEPFFGQFTRFYIGPFSRKDSLVLSRKITSEHGIDADENIHNRIFQLTAGNPFFIRAVCRRLVFDFKESITLQNVEYAFLTETLKERGEIYLVLDYMYNDSLSRAYKGKAHRAILFILAQEQGLTLSEIARRINKPSGEVSNYMKALLRTDLIIKEDDNYYFRDPIFRFWLAETYLGAGRAKLKNKVIAEQLIHDLQEKYLSASVELGKAKEYEMKVKLESRYGIKLENYPEEGEFDLVGRKNSVTYVFEIKWRNKPVDYKQIKEFFNKVEKSRFEKEEKRLFILSKEGFTKNAQDFGNKHGIELLRDG